MGLLWGNETKGCPECGMEIPSSAKTCPYCHRVLWRYSPIWMFGFPSNVIISIRYILVD